MTFWLCSIYFPFLIAREFWRISSLPLWVTSMGRKKLRRSIVTQARSRYVTQARPVGLSSTPFPRIPFLSRGRKGKENKWSKGMHSNSLSRRISAARPSEDPVPDLWTPALSHFRTTQCPSKVSFNLRDTEMVSLICPKHPNAQTSSERTLMTLLPLVGLPQPPLLFVTLIAIGTTCVYLCVCTRWVSTSHFFVFLSVRLSQSNMKYKLPEGRCSVCLGHDFLRV